MDIIFDHDAEHSISDGPKHSSNGGVKPPEFPLPLVKSSLLNPEEIKLFSRKQVIYFFTQYNINIFIPLDFVFFNKKK